GEQWILKLGRDIGQGAQCQPIDDDRQSLRDVDQQRPCFRSDRVARPGEPLAEIDNPNLPAHSFEFSNDPLVVCVAAGRRVQTARHGEGRGFHHKGASYCARATCDSESVMRIALSSLPTRPSSLARAGFANPSKIYLLRNSVVVLMPLNSGNSSRLR